MNKDKKNISECFSEEEFRIVPIDENSDLYNCMLGKSYIKNDDVNLNDLMCVNILYNDFSGNIQHGEIIVNKVIAEDVKKIFCELYESGYQMKSVHLIDEYWTGDIETLDENSMSNNNSSGFCYRAKTGKNSLSKHALGLAIDINPLQNPYVKGEMIKPQNANKYADRSLGRPHMISHDDSAYKIFTKYGFSWGGDWKSLKDYQHFEKDI